MNIVNYFSRVKDLLTHLIADQCELVSRLIVDAAVANSTIYVCGNGGSAATSDHFVNDLTSISPSLPGVRGVRAVSLCSNAAVITCLGNDKSYSDIYVAQLTSVLDDSDVVIGISASGNSQNIVKALSYAAERGASSVGITGFSGGAVQSCSQYNIHVPAELGEYGPVEDVHSTICHAISINVKCLLEGHNDWIYPHS